jgi:ATP-dependent DNA helicase PIF1
LLTLGNGELRGEVEFEDSIEIPYECNIVQEDIVDEVFQDLSDSKALADTVILTPTNEHALRMNDAVIQKMPGIPKVYTSADRVICDDEREANQYPLEFLNSITPTGMPQHRLTLKPGGWCHHHAAQSRYQEGFVQWDMIGCPTTPFTCY